MSRLGRTLSRNFKTFGRQATGFGNTLGRMLSNTGKDIARTVPQIQKVVSGVERALAPIPIVGQGVQFAGGLLNTGLNVAGNVGKSLQSGGQGIRDLSGGQYDSARQNFQSAVRDGTNAATDIAAAGLFV